MNKLLKINTFDISLELTKKLPGGGRTYNLIGFIIKKYKDYNRSLVFTKQFCCSLFCRKEVIFL